MTSPQPPVSNLNSQGTSNPIVGMGQPQAVDPSDLNKPGKHKPSIGEWVGYLCKTAIVIAILICITLVMIFCPLSPTIGAYLKDHDYWALKAINTFPVGVLSGLLFPKFWSIAKEHLPFLG